MATQRSNVDLRLGRLVVTSYSNTSAGFWAFNGWFRVLDGGAAVDDLGTVLLAALKHSKDGTPVPAKDANLFSPVMEAVGVRRYSEYLSGTLSVGVTRATELVLTPKLNTGMKRGFIELSDEIERLALTATAT